MNIQFCIGLFIQMGLCLFGVGVGMRIVDCYVSIWVMRTRSASLRGILEVYVISVIRYTEFNATYDRELSCSMSGFVDQVKFCLYAANPRTRNQFRT